MNTPKFIVAFLSLAVFATVDGAESSEVSPRLKKFYLYPLIIVHTILAVVAVVIIIKVLLAFTFFGSLSGVFNMFTGLKYLLKNKGFFKSNDIIDFDEHYEHYEGGPYFSSPHESFSPHISHGYDEYSSPGGVHVPAIGKRQDHYDGGRVLRT